MNKQKTIKARNRKGERGSVLATAALGMMSFLMAVGMGVDISHLYVAKNELQNAADAAALAGASGLNFDDTGIAIATARATAAMNSYQFTNTNVVFTPSNVRFGRNLSDFTNGSDMGQAAAAAVAADVKFVKVTTPQSPVNIAFLGMILGSSKNLWAEAVAGVSVPLNIFAGYLPVSVICNTGPCDSAVPGQMYTFRGDPGGAVSPGNFQVLAIDGSGASDDRIGLASGVKNVVGPGGYVDTKPGVTAGAVRQGVNTRFDDYGSQVDPVTFPPDTNIAENITYEQYLDVNGPKQAPSHPGVPGRRVVLIPLVEESEFAGGRTNVQIHHFGAFFLRSKVSGGSGGDIQAEYIGVGVVVGNGEYDPTAPTNPGPPIVKPVLYR